jgi:hypothetical protein
MAAVEDIRPRLFLDYRSEGRKRLSVKKPFGCHYIGFDTLFRETPITHEKLTVQPRDDFEHTTFKPGLEIVKF